MSDLTRRDVLRQLAMSIVAAGVVDRLAAQDVHHMAAQAVAASGGTYAPVALSAHQYATLERLTGLIIPVENGAPGAVEAGVAAWIDMLAGANDQLKTIFVDGLAWMDATMKDRAMTDFVSATAEQQTTLLDQIAYQRNRTPELAPGIQFFTWARRLTVDGFYTSRIGMRDIYLGNTPQMTFTVPAESLDYALKKSGL